MIKFIQNTGEYFSSNYFDEDFTKKVTEKSGYSQDDLKIFNKRISALKDKYYRYKRNWLEGNLRVKDKVTITHMFHAEVLNALGYTGDQPEYEHLYHLSETDVIPVRHILYRGDQAHLMVMEMQGLIREGDEEPDGLFEQRYNVEDEENQTPPQKYHRSQWGNVFQVPDGQHISPMIINKAISELFLTDQHRRPKYILLLAGNIIFLLEQERWFRGSYLQIDIEELFNEATIKRDYYSAFYFLLGKENLAPDSDIVLMEQLDEDSHKSAHEVTKDLKVGVIHAVEAIANEAVYYWRQNNADLADVKAEDLKNDCLTYVYRLLFLFYAESRSDLDIIPSDDPVYQHGYSLELLRDLEQTPLNSAGSQNGHFFHDSLTQLFHLLSTGYREHEEDNRSFRVRHLDSPLFDDRKLTYLPEVRLRNIVWQDVICQLSLSKKQSNKARGRISYANLGINQLGSVYESLLAFRGFFAESDYIEVHRKRKESESSEKVVNSDGSYLVPRHRMDDFHPMEVFRDKNEQVRIIPKGTFIYRLSGRDRQKSASYYTPEVLTQCTVKYTLKPILEKVENGEMKALELLELKILEPAMGAAAFHNEVINQLADAYLSYRQKELNRKVAPDKYRPELQKIKAYIALNNVYGVDLNPTAIELGKLSLWLNVIHKDMQTPFFGYRLGVGNAVVGAWLKVYRKKDFIFEHLESGNQKRTKSKKKEWWLKAPKHLSFKNGVLNRKEDEIYHFLLPDKGMVPSAGIKFLKDEYENEAKAVSFWRQEFCKPINPDEYSLLRIISLAIDQLIEEHYIFQKSVDAQTQIRDEFFGANELEDLEIDRKNYVEKERLAAGRNATNAPYYKLKLIMDYWCSLWFWDVRDAIDLPKRQEWYEDILKILNIDIDQLVEGITEVEQSDDFPPSLIQGSLFGENRQLTLKNYKKDSQSVQKKIILTLKNRPSSLLSNKRSEIIFNLSERNKYFHYQLEFIEVFKEQGGFNVIVGNPPWLPIEFDEKNIIGESYPELFLHNISAFEFSKIKQKHFSKTNSYESFVLENIGTESISSFMSNYQLFDKLKGQKSDLYKVILLNSLNVLSTNGYAGILHPLSAYDDAKGALFRALLFFKLKYLFHFRNELKLFSETNDKGRLNFAINIYSGESVEINFKLISNLFHPSTIDSCFRPISSGSQSIKIKNKEGKYIWNLDGNSNRVVEVTQDFIEKLAKAQNVKDTPKLIYLQSNLFVNTINKISNSSVKRVGDCNNYFSQCFNETTDVGDILIDINHETKIPSWKDYEFIYNGPHFLIFNPVAQTPKKVYKSNNDYQSVDLCTITEDYLPNTKYLPNRSGNFNNNLQKYKKNWFDSYRWVTRAMVGSNSERTLQTCIIPPKTSHIHGVISILFENESDLISFSILTGSIVFDFYVKINGWSNILPNSIRKLPLEIGKHEAELKVRALQLNCLNKYYALLWERNWLNSFKQDSWSKNDKRLKPFNTLTQEWKWETPLRNWFERRQALVEIDVITSMALDLTFEELSLIYNVQFPILQQNEDDTWYDTKGNIVFSCSKGLTGVGVDRPVWEQIRNLEAGETYEHTIEKSELYFGKKVIYYAPFDKCDRIEDYKVAWEYFEGVFNND
jgi:hypothetical protein